MKTQTHSRRERGQALILLALAFIGLAAFIGLVVDAGILFINVGHLRRAVDAASLAAASQFREGRAPPELESSAQEFVRLNGLDDTTVDVKVCDITGSYSAYNDPALCPPVGDPPRKVVQVTATSIVNFAFLPIIGWESTPISANAISEAASVDLVLTIDVSQSMAYDLCKDGIDNDGDGVMDEQDCDDYYGGPPFYNGGPNGHDESWVGDPLDSSAGGCRWATDAENKCHPFEEVRAAAKELVQRTNFPYDRVSVVTFGSLPTIILDLESCQADPDPESCVTDGLNSMEVEWPPEPTSTYCPGWPPDPRGCMPTNIADGLAQAGNEFGPLVVGDPPRGRQEAVWIVVLLTDGAANAAVTSWGPPIVWTCPMREVARPTARTAMGTQGHGTTAPTRSTTPMTRRGTWPISSDAPTPTRPNRRDALSLGKAL
jgi:Flp pilus assembly protein TadG